MDVESALVEDSIIVAKGQGLFNQQCGGCHNFKQDGIGPNLGGITTELSTVWIKNFIRNPQKVVQSGDKKAKELLKKYKVLMPSFALNNEELNAIVAFLEVQKKSDPLPVSGNEKGIDNPIAKAIKTSDLVVGLKEFTQIPSSIDSGKTPAARISKLDFQPKTGTTFILDLRGKLYRLQGNQPFVYMDMAKLAPAFIHTPGLATGFGSFAFHPDFNKNGLIYTTHTEPAGAAKADFYYPDSIKVALQWVVTEWKADHPASSTFSGTGRELFRVNMVSGIHGVQEISFHQQAKPGDDDYGLLYIGVGDGGSAENGYLSLSHSKEKIWGTLLRINPLGRNSLNGRYGIPATNPFAKSNDSKVLKEMYAYGFRNPHRITWSKNGQMLVSNVGHANIESINLIAKGYDYGWPVREGTFLLHPSGNLNFVYPLPADDSSYHIHYPVVEYDHDEGKAISGGFEYTGSAIPELKGKFLFGDIPTGRLFYVEMKDIRQGMQAPITEWNIAIDGKQTTFSSLYKNQRVDLHFGKDVFGELYLLTKYDGKVYKLMKVIKR